MSSTFIKKLTLVGPGGLAYGQYPNSDDTKTQLQSGFISAMLNFSQEVHQSILESLTLHDRTMSFVQLINKFILIAEFSNTIDKSLMGRILGQMKTELDQKLDGMKMGTIDPQLGDRVLWELAAQEWMDRVLSNFGLEKPLASAQIKQNDQGKISEKIDTVISKFDKFTVPFLLPLRSENICLYVVPFNGSSYYLKLPETKETDLFRLAPLLSREVRYLSGMNIETSTVMDRLRSMPDMGYQINKENEELISFKFLLDNVKKKLERGVEQLIRGNRVLVVGEKITVRIVTLTLQIFTQHIHSEVNEWLDKEASDLPNGTVGMSNKKFEELSNHGMIPEETVVFDLENKRVLGGHDNKYVKLLLKEIRNLTRKEREKYVREELNYLVEQALNVTELLSLPMEEAKHALSGMKKEINNQGKFDLILGLSSQRNPALKSVITTLSETLQKAESYLGEF